MKKYEVIPLTDLQTNDNTWTKGFNYEVTETRTKFHLTSNEGQITFQMTLKPALMENFIII